MTDQPSDHETTNCVDNEPTRAARKRYDNAITDYCKDVRSLRAPSEAMTLECIEALRACDQAEIESLTNSMNTRFDWFLLIFGELSSIIRSACSGTRSDDPHRPPDPFQEPTFLELTDHFHRQLENPEEEQ